MEFIHALADGRKAVIYDEGNSVTAIFITNIRNMQSANLARDYLASLDCIYFRGNIYIVYISNANEVKFRQVGSEEALVLISDANDLWNISGLRLFILNEKLYVSYQIYNQAAESYEIRYINPRGDRKSRLITSRKEKIHEYGISRIDDEEYLRIKCDGSDFDYYRMIIDGNEDITLAKRYLVDEAVQEEKLRAGKEQLERKINQEYDEKLKAEIKQLKDELEERRTAEIDSISANYQKQYNELSELTRQIQDEGKKYRDMYVQTLEALEKTRKEQPQEKQISKKASTNSTTTSRSTKAKKTDVKKVKEPENQSKEQPVDQETETTTNPVNP